MSVIQVQKHGEDGTALVTLNRPAQMNALSRELRGAIAETFVALAADENVRAIVLTGAGRAFCAGLDLKELGDSGGPISGDANSSSPERNPVLAMTLCPKPIVGAINGAAVTGGFELALACDILLGSPATRFADTHARVGILPGWGLSQKLSRIVGISRAKEISLSGNYVDAETALAWGLINRLYAAEDLLPAALKLAAEIASAPAATTQAYKQLIDEGAALSFGDAMAHELAFSSARNAKVGAGHVATVRAGVMARGRDQTKG
jgi:enoyl-CoA hydratase